jgi:hypothetical protein
LMPLTEISGGFLEPKSYEEQAIKTAPKVEAKLRAYSVFFIFHFP